MNSMFWVWLSVAVIMAIVEAATPSLFTIWFMFGAVVSMLSAALGASLGVQLIIFVTVSTVLLVVTRPLVKRFIKTDKNENTNADRIINQTGIVTEEINNIENRGQIMVMGQCWSAKSENNVIIGEGEIITVTEIIGVKAVVKKKED